MNEVQRIAHDIANLQGRRHRKRRKELVNRMDILIKEMQKIPLMRHHRGSPEYKERRQDIRNASMHSKVGTFKMMGSFRHCNYCKKEMLDWKRCECTKAWYCGKKCQRKDKTHLAECVVYQRMKKKRKQIREK